MKYLALTLGHNSSALFYDAADGQVVGFEEERLTGLKNDSSFPRTALTLIEDEVGHMDVDTVYVSHWFDRFDPKVETKYWDPEFFSPHVKIVCVDHHEAHAWSAVAFYEQQIPPLAACDVLVIDGFGNDQNTLSLYAYDPAHPTQLTQTRKVYGYETSLGLLYQWAAEVEGMDGMADVYKFLGYRVHIDPSIKPQLDQVATDLAEMYLAKIFSETNSGKPFHRTSRDVIDKPMFGYTKDMVTSLLRHMVPQGRENMGYVVQKVLEDCVFAILDHWVEKNPNRPLLVAGGCFYNVRLNMLINERMPNPFCPMPVAGDQGCAFGLIRSVNPAPVGLLRSLCIGRREFSTTKERADAPAGFFHFGHQDPEALHFVIAHLEAGVIVNLVDRHMEYGPRALCQTSSLCKPTMENVEIINSLNSRNTVMPMAPVMTRPMAFTLFGDVISKVLGSDAFMIMAFRYLDDVVDQYNIRGAAHTELEGGYSGRPQIACQYRDKFIHQVLFQGGFPCLINTSLNYHGEPIIFTHYDAVDLHERWTERAQELGVDASRFVTVWLD